MNERLRAIILVLSGSFLVLSCATMRHLLGVVADKPTVRLVNVDIRSISTKRMELDFVLEVFNPNSFGVDIQELKYDVKSMDLDLGEGSYPDVIMLKSKEKVEVRLPFRVDPDNLVNLMKRYLANPKELKVQLKADLFLDTALGKMDMHFQEEKTIMKGLAPQ
ncbi:MAG: LEA type 2 family protein [Bdellovibrionota bacterium]|nr:MAG: hypothetical protein EOP10_27010 [Pseudomonadota bacterium]